MGVGIINEHAFMQQMRAQIEAELNLAAEPLLEKAVEDIRKHLRARMAEMALTMLEQTYSLERDGRFLRITVNLAESGK